MFELSQDDELKLEKNLVWIFADRRSGTTWLSQELLSHKTLWMDEPLIGLHLGRTVNTKDGMKKTLDIQAKRENYFFCKNHKENWTYFLRKLILNRIYNQFKTLDKKIIIKEPSGSSAADILTDCLPHSKIIVLLRDGRDIVDSKIDAESEGGWELKDKPGIKKVISGERRMGYLQKQSKNWVGLMEILLNTHKKHSSDLRILKKYESLRYDTFNELKTIYQFIGVDIDEKTLTKIVDKFSFENVPEKQKGKGMFKRFASAGKWKENLRPEEIRIVNKIMHDTLKKLDYETD